MQRGKLVILAIVALALLLAGYAWWHRYQQGRRALELWGAENAVLIRRAKRVELLTLGEGNVDEDSEILTIAGRKLRVVKREDVSRARGLIHARHALIEDASFDWKRTAAAGRDNWQYVLRFADETHAIHLALDLHCGRAYLVENQAEVLLVERIKKALAKYIGDHFERPGES